MGAKPSSPTVSSLYLPAYMGRWYQIANIPQWYEPPPCNVCTQADYKLENGVVQIVNTSGKQEDKAKCTVSGYATVPNPTEPGQFNVWIQGAPIASPAQYWVVMLGPLNSSTGLYEYAVVSNSAKSTLYILNRQPQMHQTQYVQIVSLLALKGYPVRKLVATDQTVCSTPPPTSVP